MVVSEGTVNRSPIRGPHCMLETVIPFKVHLDFIFLKRYSLRRAMTINHVDSSYTLNS
jgi:hypothetical protein